MAEKVYRILIAEDEPRIAAFMVKGLQKSGFVPEVVSDGDAALETLAKEEFDLLLLDLGLPGTTGQDVLEAMKLQGITLPTIVVTALSIDPGDTGMQAVFAHEVVSKPFLMKDLIQKVQRLLQDSSDALST